MVVDPSDTSAERKPGGGSGGCIKMVLRSADPLSLPLATAVNSCQNSVCAIGGDGDSGGGGGRIMISAPQNSELTSGSWSETLLKMSAFGGKSRLCSDNACGTSCHAASGTKYISNAGPVGLLSIDGNGSPITDNAITPISKAQWLAKSTPTSVSIRNKAQVGISEWVGWKGQLQTLSVKSGSLLYKCKDSYSKSCHDQVPDPESGGVHNFPSEEINWLDCENPKEDQLCLQAAVLSVSGTSTQLSGGNLSILCDKLILGTAAQEGGNPSAIVTDSGVYIAATMSIDIERSTKIVGSSTPDSDGSAHEALLRCANCTINMGGTIQATVTNLTAETVNIKGSGRIHGEPFDPALCSDPVTFTCAQQPPANGSAAVYIHGNRTKVLGRASSGLIFICPHVADYYQSPRNLVTIQGAGVLDVSGGTEGGCPANNGLGAPRRDDGGGAGHGGNGGQGWINGPNGSSFWLGAPGGPFYDNRSCSEKWLYSEKWSLHVGSGGGGEDGGAGGGLVAILARRLELEHHSHRASIVADGGNATGSPADGTNSKPGGGSGGSVMLQVGQLAGWSAISARGGAGASGSKGAGGGGGGGVVAIRYIGAKQQEDTTPFNSPELAAAGYNGSIDVSPGLGGKIRPGGKIIPSGPPPAPESRKIDLGAVHVLEPWSLTAADLQSTSVPAEMEPGPEPAPSPPPVGPTAGEPGKPGTVLSPPCKPGYSGCICRPCQAGSYLNISTQCGQCLNCMPPDLQKASDLHGHLHGHPHRYFAKFTKIGASKENECEYKCRAELIWPHCVNCFMTLYILVGSNVFLLALVSVAPLLLLVALRFLLYLILVGDKQGSAPQAASVNVVNVDNEYSSLMSEEVWDTDKATFAQQLRKLVGISSPRAADTSGSLLQSEFTAGVNRLGFDDDDFLYTLAIRQRELPYLLCRIYLTGCNSISSPWSLPKEPPAALKDLGIDVDKYADIATKGTAILSWSLSETIVFWILSVVCIPWARSWHKKCRKKHFSAFGHYVREDFQWNVFLDSAMQSKQNSVKLGCSKDATSCYIDILDYKSGNNSHGRRQNEGETPGQTSGLRLPQALQLAGTGAFDVPFQFDTNDALAQTICELASKAFAQRLNCVLQPLGAGLNLAPPDISLEPLLNFINSENDNPQSKVRFQVCTKNAHRECRLFLQARYKVGESFSATSHSPTLIQDMSGELSQTAKLTYRPVDVDDLYPTGFMAMVQQVLTFVSGLQNPMLLPEALFPVTLALQILLFGAETLGTTVLLTALFLLSPTDAGVIVLAVQPGAVIIAPLISAVDIVFHELDLSHAAVFWNICSIISVGLTTLWIILIQSKPAGLDTHTYLFAGSGKYLIEPGNEDHGRISFVRIACFVLLAVKILRSIVANFVRSSWQHAQLLQDLHEDKLSVQRRSESSTQHLTMPGTLPAGRLTIDDFGAIDPPHR
eukprot:SAG31_NODE_716_length_12626_cov_7.493973_8_plen_1439_part_00